MSTENVSNEQKGNELNPLLGAGLLPLTKLPDNYSFRCIIQFEEYGFDGEKCRHMSTGYWWHRDMGFSVDNSEMQELTPMNFIPLYDVI